MSEDRDTEAEDVQLIPDVQERARREAENGILQYKEAERFIIASLSEDKFRLRQGIILALHEKALAGIHKLAGTYRNSFARITNSSHELPNHNDVADLVSDMCDYVNGHWDDRNSIHLYAYVMWRLNWIHPFADGNGRTARTLGYVVLSAHLKSFLPGSPTIPDLIDADKDPYYDALEKADYFWKNGQRVSLETMERYLEGLLEEQLRSAIGQAAI